MVLTSWYIRYSNAQLSRPLGCSFTLSMALQTAHPIFCNNIGNATSFDCCEAAEQDSRACRYFLSHEIHDLSSACNHTDCFGRCSDPSFIFASKGQEIGEVTGVIPIRHFHVCSNFPYMAASFNQSVLEPAISSAVQYYVPRDASNDAFKNIAFAVTDCLTTTCRNARKPEHCLRSCSGANLVVNITTPNLSGLNEWMNSLYSGNESSLPFADADADVVGIGVSVCSRSPNCGLTRWSRFSLHISCNVGSLPSCGLFSLGSRFAKL
jgi:hypothetical protein